MLSIDIMIKSKERLIFFQINFVSQFSWSKHVWFMLLFIQFKMNWNKSFYWKWICFNLILKKWVRMFFYSTFDLENDYQKSQLIFRNRFCDYIIKSEPDIKRTKNLFFRFTAFLWVLTLSGMGCQTNTNGSISDN